MGVGMAGVGMNVMHDGNHGVFDQGWVNKFMVEPFMYWQETYTTGKYSTMCYTIPILTYLDMMKI
jgi:fatty acid desaturase